MRVEIFSIIPGADIYYTTNGDTPTLTSAKYEGVRVAFDGTTTLKAIAIAPGRAVSDVAVGKYVRLGGSPPVSVTFDPPSGSYASPQTVTLFTPSSKATICYTFAPGTPLCDTASTDTEQCVSSSKYTGPMVIEPTASGVTIRAVACRWGYGTSEMTQATYTTP